MNKFYLLDAGWMKHIVYKGKSRDIILYSYNEKIKSLPTEVRRFLDTWSNLLEKREVKKISKEDMLLLLVTDPKFNKIQDIPKDE